MLGKEKIDELDNFFNGVVLVKNDGCNEDVRSKITNAQGVLFTVENKFRRIGRKSAK